MMMDDDGWWWMMDGRWMDRQLSIRTYMHCIHGYIHESAFQTIGEAKQTSTLHFAKKKFHFEGINWGLKKGGEVTNSIQETLR